MSIGSKPAAIATAPATGNDLFGPVQGPPRHEGARPVATATAAPGPPGRGRDALSCAFRTSMRWSTASNSYAVISGTSLLPTG